MIFSASILTTLVSLPVLIGAGLVLAIIMLVAAIWILRSGKKKTANGAADWQRQSQQGAAGWNQTGQPAQPSAAWGQQAPQAAGWSQQSQPGAAGNWGAMDATQAAGGGWSPQQQQAASPWGAAGAGTPNAQQQQPAAGGQWGTGTQHVDPQANPWGAQGAAQPQTNPWAAQQASQGAPAQSPWGAQQGQGQAPWEAQQPAAAQQSPWAAQGQQASPWEAPAQGQGQQAPTAYSGSSGPAWGQPAASSVPATADPWGASAPSWQQAGPAAGNPRPPVGQDATMFANNDGDKTMLRPGGAPGSVGMVRVEEGKEPGRIYEVRKESLSIGRSRESDIFLEDLAVSRLHASIVNIGNGSYALKDEGSANGTKVNGQLVSKYQTFPLQEGDRIQLGQTVLVFAKR